MSETNWEVDLVNLELQHLVLQSMTARGGLAQVCEILVDLRTLAKAEVPRAVVEREIAALVKAERVLESELTGMDALLLGRQVEPIYWLKPAWRVWPAPARRAA